MAVLSRLASLPATSTLVSFLSKYPRALQDMSKTSNIRLILVTFAVLTTLIRVIKVRYFHPLSHIPSTFFSVSYVFTAIGTYFGRSHIFLPAVHWRFGNIVRIAPDIISVTDKDVIREVLVSADYPKSEIYQALELYDQHSLFSSRNKDFHKNRRRLVAPAFGLSYLRSLEPLMADCIKVMIEKIDQLLEDPKLVKAGTKVLPQGHINVFSFMNRLSFDIIGETAFGESFDMVKNDNHPVPKQMAKTLKRSWQQSFSTWIKRFIPLDYSFIKFGQDRVKKRKDLGEEGRRADLLQFLIDAQAKERAEGNGETGNEYEDMISGKLTDRAVETEAIVFLIAGSETSSTAMTNTLMYLVRNPSTLKRLRDEIDEATSRNPYGTLPTYDEIRNLPYLNACIKESMRIRPVAVSGLPREVPEDTVMSGYRIPKGTIVLAQVAHLHWNEKYFPNAKKFVPERWIPEESPYPPIDDFTYYPFSAGTRNCVGKNFAMMEMKLILASIILNYDLEYVPGQRTDYVQFITTAFSTESYVIKMRKRNSALETILV